MTDRTARRPIAATIAAIAALAVAGIVPASAAGPVAAAFAVAPDGSFPARLAADHPDASRYPLTWAHSNGEPISVAQPDGTRIQVVGTDMEVGGVAETVDGYSVMRNPSSGWWVYALKGENGWEVPTEFRAGIDTPRGIPKHAARAKSVWIDARGTDARAQIYEALRQHSVQLQAKAAAASANGASVFKIPALMLETHGAFAEESTPAFFESLLSGTRDEDETINPRGTMTELYLEQSWGKMEPRIDVYGPYKSPASMASRCFYGRKAPGDASSPGPTGPPVVATVGGMALEAVPQADPEVNFADYDNDGDGAVDFLLVIHSGTGREATLDDCDVHSHYFSLATVATTDIDSEGRPVIIQSAMTIPEFGLQIGVAAHEFMHALGEPDYYDTDGTGEGTGEWDLGGGGPWLGYPPQSNSVHFNPFMKVNLGWVTPTLIATTTKNIRLRPRELFDDLVVIPVKTQDCTDTSIQEWCYDIDGKSQEITEGYLLEMNSRTANGTPSDSRLPRAAIFDRFTHASGMMAWHFDSTLSANSDETHMRVDLEEADWRDGLQDVQVGLSRGDPGDLFYDDATGLSGATATKLITSGDGVPQGPPEGSPWTVTSPPAPCSDPDVDCPNHPGAQPVPEWEVTDDPDNVVMRVMLDWESNSADDWDLYVDQQQEDGSWLQIASSTSGTDPHLPDTGVPENETTVVRNPDPGRYRARAVNWLGPTQLTAQISVEFKSSFGKGGSPNTLDWEDQQTGWSFTNIRPAGDGVTVDVVKHSASTFDLSPDIVTTKEALRVGHAGAISTRVYNHGGKEVRGVDLTVFENGRSVATRRIPVLKAYDHAEISIPFTPTDRGDREFLTRIQVKPGEVVTGNNHQRSTLYVGDANARVLIVDDDQNFGLEKAYAGALASLGVPLAITGDHPSRAELKRYAAVIWSAGSTQRKNSVDIRDRANVSDYLKGGGKLLITGSRTISGISAVDSDWLPEHLGLKHKDIWQYGTGAAKGNGFSFHADLAPGRSLMDEYEVDGGTELYRLDPEVEHEVEGTVGVRYAAGTSKTETHSFSLGQLRDGEVRQQILKSTLAYFGVPLGGRAADAAPLIHHAPWRVRLNGQATPVVATVSDADGLASVTLRYRSGVGSGAWTIVPMLESNAANVFEAMIPASVVTPAGFEYAIEATDRTGVAAAGELNPVASAIGPAFGAYPSIVSPRAPSTVGGVKSGAPLPATGVGSAVLVALLMAIAASLAVWLRGRTA
ncbi:MAG TPA: M6 family metalloprotease domain-containing protein [Actinomycetota bacterium]